MAAFKYDILRTLDSLPTQEAQLEAMKQVHSSHPKRLVNVPVFSPSEEARLEAFKSIQDEAESVRQLIVDTVRTSPAGFTCDDLEVHLGLSHQSCSARCAELKQTGRLFTRAGCKRPTRSGRNAAVLYSTP